METMVPCPSCDATLRIRNQALSGKTIRCPKCQGAVRIPASDISGSSASGSARSGKQPARPGEGLRRSESQGAARKREIPNRPRRRDQSTDDDEVYDDQVDSDDIISPRRHGRDSVRSSGSGQQNLPPRSGRRTHPKPARNVPWAVLLGTAAAAGILGLAALAFKFLLPSSEPDRPGTVATVSREDATPEKDITPKEDTTENQQTVASSLLGMLPGGQSPDNAPSESEAQVTARSNLKKLGLGMHNFHDSYGSFPLPRKTEADFRDRYVDAQGRVLLSWRVHILPYLGEANLYHQFHLDEPWDSAHNRTLLEKMPQIYAASEVGTKPGYTCIQAPCSKGTVMEGGRGCKIKDVHDGLQNTVLLVRTNAALAVSWTKPADYDVVPEQAMSGMFFENDIAIFLMCNGLVETVDRKSDQGAKSDGRNISRMAALFTIAGNDIPGG